MKWGGNNNRSDISDHFWTFETEVTRDKKGSIDVFSTGLEIRSIPSTPSAVPVRVA